MNKEKLSLQLKRLIDEYIEDDFLARNLIATLDETKAKYVLAEVEMNKYKEYTPESKAIIQDIAFYYY